MTHLTNIHSTFADYQEIINLHQKHKGDFLDTISIDVYQWFSANMCAVLGSVLDLFIEDANTAKFNHIDPVVKTILLKNDFLSYFGYPRLPDNNHTTIRFLKLKPTDGKFFNNYVFNELIGRTELPAMSNLLKHKMSEAIYEIFVNAQMHSDTQHIYTCGQFFPKKDIIEFTLVDTGIGFKRKVNERFNRDLTSIQAIKWATVDGHTTKVGMPGGIGLALLKEFIKKNKGMLQIISDDGYYEYGTHGEKTKIFNGSFPGTIVNLQLRTNDGSSYSLKGESKK